MLYITLNPAQINDQCLPGLSGEGKQNNITLRNKQLRLLFCVLRYF